MSMSDWAKREVEIACKQCREEENDGEQAYVMGCYQSALKAYLSLMEDNHSGMSFSITKGILNRLMDGKPLTPIDDTPDVWADVSYGDDGTKTYQCKRMPSLFKTVKPDGNVSYSDTGRVVCHNADKPHIRYSSWRSRNIVDEMHPITMPYNPPNGVYDIECEELLTDRKNGDFDTWAYLTMKTPEEEKITINRYFKYNGGQAKEIKRWEYLARKQLHEGRVDQELKEQKGTF